jgi:hypothetical protein
MSASGSGAPAAPVPTLPVSRHRLPGLAALLVVALLPTLVHSYRGYDVTPTPITANTLPRALGGAAGVDRARDPVWMRATFGADSWAERAYEVPGQGRLTIFAARGSDLKKLYHHPELGALHGRSFDRVRLVPLDADATRPMHVLQNDTTGDSAIYVLLYDGEWVSNPYWLQVSSAVSSLWRGRRPLTLVMVYGPGVLENGLPVEAARRALAEAVRQIG